MRKRGTATYALGQYNEVLERLIRVMPRVLEGTNPKDILGLVSNSNALVRLLRPVFHDFLEGEPIPITTVTVSPLKFDKTEDGWELLEDVPLDTGLDPIDLELVRFLRGGEGLTDARELTRRAISLNANFGQRHAEWLLQCQRFIPEEWQDYNLVFPGTRWRSQSGSCHVPFLRLIDRWDMRFGAIDGSWGDYCRFIHLRQ